jgi:hypothetical protein
MTSASTERRPAFRPLPTEPRPGRSADVTRSILKGVIAAAVLIAACLAVAAAGPAHAGGGMVKPPNGGFPTAHLTA